MESENPHPPKRAREDAVQGSGRLEDTPIVVSKHSQYWFDDGNVNLQAGSVQFKVHRSVLSNQSQIFKDMFSIPQPPGSSADSDECPVIVLHDSLEDVENLLSLLYDTMRIYNRREKMSLSVLGSMLRLGKKYRFKHLIAEALHCLNLEFPSKFDPWSARDLTGSMYIQTTPQFAFDVLYLAHEFSIKSILPAVYLMICSQVSIDQIRVCFDRPQHKHLLKTDEPFSFLSGREKLLRAIYQKSLAWIKEDVVPCKDCAQRKNCTSHIAQIMKALLDMEIRKVIRIGMARSWDTSNLKAYFCSPCRDVAKEHFEAERRKIWDEVPEFFELKDEDFDAPWHTDTFSDEASDRA